MYLTTFKASLSPSCILPFKLQLFLNNDTLNFSGDIYSKIIDELYFQDGKKPAFYCRVHFYLDLLPQNL